MNYFSKYITNHNMNWMSILGLCLILGGTVLSFIGTITSDNKAQKELTTKIEEKNKTIEDISISNNRLIEQNSLLLSSTERVSNTNNDLIDQNKEMIQRISLYQEDIEAKNKEIENLRENLGNIKNFAHDATLDVFGLPMKADGAIVLSSPYSKLMNKIFIRHKDNVSLTKDVKLSDIEDAIKSDPNSPFGYAAKAFYLLNHHNPNWKLFAEKAIDILNITTSFEGHKSDHDNFLRTLKELLVKVENL